MTPNRSAHAVSACVLVLCLNFAAAAQAQEKLKTPEMPPGWEIGNVQQTKDQLLIEHVRTGEKIDKWTQLATIQQIRRNKSPQSPREFYEQAKAVRSGRCPDATVWEVLDEDAMSLIYEWTLNAPCDGAPPQKEIVRILYGKKTTMYRLALTARTDLAEQERTDWLAWLRAASVTK